MHLSFMGNILRSISMCVFSYMMSHGACKCLQFIYIITPLKFNSSPLKTGWLEDYFPYFGWSKKFKLQGAIVFSLDLPRFTQEVCGSASNLPPDPNLTPMDTENWSEHHPPPTSTLENEASDTCSGACAAW